MVEPNNARLAKIQQELDNSLSEHLEEDFALKLKYHKKIADKLEERDKIIEEEFSPDERMEFYSQIFTNFEPLKDFFPLKDDQTVDFSFLKSLKAEYLDNFKMRVVLELYENEYVANKTLVKTVRYLDNEIPETTKIMWKNEKGDCPLFDFFENEDDDFEAFDILYEFYSNMFFLANMDVKE